MAPRNKDNDIGLTLGTPAHADYLRDLYRWSQEQARAVREGRWNEVDRENVAEEIESVGKKEFDQLVGALRALMLHMLIWEHQPEGPTRSRTFSIKLQRNEINNLLKDSPSLRLRLAQAIERSYRQARIDIARETGLDEQPPFRRRVHIHSTNSPRAAFRPDGDAFDARAENFPQPRHRHNLGIYSTRCSNLRAALKTRRSKKEAEIASRSVRS